MFLVCVGAFVSRQVELSSPRDLLDLLFLSQGLLLVVSAKRSVLLEMC